jgi:type II secretory pathway predicted ATPase ExeA
MLCRVLMERVPAHVETIYLATPSLARDEILHAIADDLDLKLSDGRMTVALRELQEALIRLYAAGRRVVILIDEAHVMPEETLEQVRLLSNLESNRHKLMQIVLFGQPELDATLAKPSLRQLRDRITNSFRMRPLSEHEVAKYLSFRMRAAGYRGPEVFAPRAIALISRASHGLTRRINILADKSLLAAYSENSHAIAERQVRAAIADAEFAAVRKPPRPVALVVGLALVLGLAAGVAIQWSWSSKPAPVPVAKAPAPPPLPPKAPEPRAEPAEAKLTEIKPEPVPPPAAPAAPLPSPPRQMTEEQERRVATYSAARQQLLAERLTATREVLDRAPGERYSLELFITDNTDPARMERFLLRARDLVPLERIYIIPMGAAGQGRLRVVFGEFDSREEALEAARRLPPRYQQAFNALPRTFAELRGQI